MRQNILSALLILALFIPFQTIASTNVTSNITTNTTWNVGGSPYNVLNDVQVYENVTLTIDPGVEVVFQGTASMEVAGQLIARGTNNSPIILSSNNIWNRNSSYGVAGITIFTYPLVPTLRGQFGNQGVGRG